ncbi:MAG TPA: phospho-sugar mutase, partial [Beutenbergiaceae bacterium]|nr:phospho-sugar mutase [Beutenbergiaceae bacterium]
MTNDPAALFEKVRAWIEDDPDPTTAAELQELLDRARSGSTRALADLESRFRGFLEFGTAGLRGRLGGGPARMNLAVVSRAAAGLIHFLTHALDGEPARVVIGFDARHRSRDFAYASASIIAGAGGRVSVFDHHCPTPVLAYAVRHLDADAGIMVTASHNPAHDNGYKVYLGGRMAPEEGQGVQIVTPDDEHIAKAIAAVDSVADLPKAHTYQVVGQDLVDSYIDAVAQLPGSPPRPDVAIVYTPLHGVGGQVALEVFARAGLTNVTPVLAQLDPDPDFPTVAFPNPEEPGALDLAFETATAIDADVVIAHDPDADRVAVGVPSSGGWHQLSGDDVGALLGE